MKQWWERTHSSWFHATHDSCGWHATETDTSSSQGNVRRSCYGLLCWWFWLKENSTVPADFQSILRSWQRAGHLLQAMKEGHAYSSPPWSKHQAPFAKWQERQPISVQTRGMVGGLLWWQGSLQDGEQTPCTQRLWDFCNKARELRGLWLGCWAPSQGDSRNLELLECWGQILWGDWIRGWVTLQNKLGFCVDYVADQVGCAGTISFWQRISCFILAQRRGSAINHTCQRGCSLLLERNSAILNFGVTLHSCSTNKE